MQRVNSTQTNAALSFTDLMSNKNTEEQVELVEINLARTVSVQHVKHVVYLFRLQIGHVMYYLVELDVYIPQTVRKICCMRLDEFNE